MDAPCKIQGSIHVFRLVNNMCPGKWVHIKMGAFYILNAFDQTQHFRSPKKGLIKTKATYK